MVPQRRVAILAYGSLIRRPGPSIEMLVRDREPVRTPFPVEYGRASPRWGGGPVLVPHPAGGPVDGVLLVLAPGVGLGRAAELLAEREGAPSGGYVVEVATGVPAGLLVIAAALPRNLPDPDLDPAALARRAAGSAAAGPANGVAYLRLALDAGVRTPRTEAYAEAVMRLAGASDLAGAERRLVALAGARRGGDRGLG